VVITNRNIQGVPNARNAKKKVSVIGSKTSRDLKDWLILLRDYDFFHRGGRLLCIIFDLEFKIPPRVSGITTRSWRRQIYDRNESLQNMNPR
jgi:hypothetical protein